MFKSINVKTKFFTKKALKSLITVTNSKFSIPVHVLLTKEKPRCLSEFLLIIQNKTLIKYTLIENYSSCNGNENQNGLR